MQAGRKVDGDLGPNVVHPSFLMSSVAWSCHLQPPYLQETRKHVLSPCLLSRDCRLQLSDPVSNGRGATADLPLTPQEQKPILLGAWVKQLSFLTHPLWEDGETRDAHWDCGKETPKVADSRCSIDARLSTTSYMCRQPLWAQIFK